MVPYRRYAWAGPTLCSTDHRGASRRERIARQITNELAAEGITLLVRTVSRHLAYLGLNRRRFLDPTGELNRAPHTIVARWPGHMVHLDVQRSIRSPTVAVGVSSRDQDKLVSRGRICGGRARYTYLHSAVDGFSRLAYTEALPGEKTATAIGFTHRARAFFAAHGITHVHRIVTDIQAWWYPSESREARPACENPGVPTPVCHHCLTDWGSRLLPVDRWGKRVIANTRRPASLTIGGPLLRQIQLPVHQRASMPGRIRQEHADLRVLNPACGSRILAGPHRPTWCPSSTSAGRRRSVLSC